MNPQGNGITLIFSEQKSLYPNNLKHIVFFSTLFMGFTRK